MTEEGSSQPFDTIESAQEFMVLLSESVHEAITEVEQDLQEAIASGKVRREEALRIVILKINQLNLHVHRSRRLLNDLRSLRRLLLEERREQAS
jgi:hypothetical protein